MSELNTVSSNLKIVDLKSEPKRKGGLIDLDKIRKGWAERAAEEAANRPLHIVVNPRNRKSKVSKWARIPSFTLYDKTYLVVKYRRRKDGKQRFGCTCEDFALRKGCNEGRGRTRTCKHIRLFRQKEREMLDTMKEENKC